jgi:hypothetical protein
MRLFTQKRGKKPDDQTTDRGGFELFKAPKREEKLFPKSTPFSSLPARFAIFIIVLLIMTIVYGLISYHPLPSGGDRAGEDIKCYRGIIERIHAGEGYYAAAGEELRTRGYPTSSVFNWRLPTLAWFMGHLPNLAMGRGLAIILAFLTLALWISVLQKEASFPKLILAAFCLLGHPIYSLLPEVILIHEFWAGLLITLSLGAYARGWRIFSLASGVLALFVRELTLPYTFLMMVAAYMEGDRREGLFWLLGILAFGVSLAYHATVVKSLVIEGEVIQETGWLVLGGWSFVLSTVHTHLYLLLFPGWIPAMLLPLILLGFAGWRGPVGSRMAWTIGFYIASYSVVGKPFNQLWGMMYVNIMLLGILYFPSSLYGLWVSAVGCKPRNCMNSLIGS